MSDTPPHHGETSVLGEKPLWGREGKIVGRYVAPSLHSMPGVEHREDQTGAAPRTGDDEAG